MPARNITLFPSQTAFFEFDKFHLENSNYYFIIDSKINELYKLPKRINRFVTIANEKNKSLKTATKIIDDMLQKQLDKNTIIVAVGGGIICDIAGFVSTIYKRGVECILIPTTLLAMVDAAYGGKSGVNHNNIKNSLGSIKVPHKVLIDTDFIKTLNNYEIKNGFCEIIKIAFTSNLELFKLIRTLPKNLKKIDWEEIIRLSILTKEQYIRNDINDKSIRKILNFGHTIGHSIELKHKIKHGYAISLGALIELKIIAKKYNMNNDLYNLYRDTLYYFGVKTHIHINLADLIDNIYQDKKKKNTAIELVKINSVGKSELSSLDLNEIINILKNDNNNLQL